MLKGERPRPPWFSVLRSSQQQRLAGSLAGLLFVVFYLSGIPGIPFHPDESTYLYMSGDLEAVFHNPLRLGYNPQTADDPRQRYRLLDAPLSRLAIGFARRLAGYAALPVDWDWALTWEENAAAGALPEPGLLLAGRLASSTLALLGLFCLYFTGRGMDRPLTGFLAAGFLSLNALYWLHARRAMSEGPLLFGVCLAMWGLIEGERRPWLAGLGAAIALNAKQSTLVLVPVGLLAVLWLVDTPVERRGKQRWANLVQYAAVFIVVTLALNPWLWRQPGSALKIAVGLRRNLLAYQVRNIASFAPHQVLEGAGPRLLAAGYNLFVAPLSFAELGKYRTATAASETTYLSNPLHSLLRSPAGGGLLLTLCIFGAVLALLGLRRAAPGRQRGIGLLLLAGTVQLAAIIAVVPFTWQRYPIPLLPFICLWMAYAIRRPDRSPAVSSQLASGEENMAG